MASAFFLPTPPIPYDRRVRIHRVFLAKSTSTRTIRNAKPANRTPAQLPRKPTNPPEILFKPESVVVATAAYSYILLRFLYRSGRHAVETVSTRRTQILAERSKKEQLKAKWRKQEFLESAIISTKATLQNTKTFLTAQQSRAEAAEIRLSQVGVSRDRLDCVAEEIRQRKKELAIAELNLSREQKIVEAAQLEKMEGNVTTAKGELRAFEERLERERGELDVAECTQKGSLQSARKETARLKTLLIEKEIQLEGEKVERDRYLKTVTAFDRNLKLVNADAHLSSTELDQEHITLRDFKDEATLADENGASTEFTYSVPKIRKQEDLESTLQRMQNQQQNIRQALSKARDAEIESTLNRDSLFEKVALRDAELKKLREDLVALEKLQKSPKPKTKRKTKRKEPVNTAESVAKYADSQNNVSASKQVPMSELSKPKTTKVELPIKRKRGRPRKNPLPSPDTADVAKPKRGRGRPRKVVIEDTVAASRTRSTKRQQAEA